MTLFGCHDVTIHRYLDYSTVGPGSALLTQSSGVIMDAMTSQITGVPVVYSIVCSASLTSVKGIHRWPVKSPHKVPVTRKSFHLMTSSCSGFPSKVKATRKSFLLKNWEYVYGIRHNIVFSIAIFGRKLFDKNLSNVFLFTITNNIITWLIKTDVTLQSNLSMNKLAYPII